MKRYGIIAFGFYLLVFGPPVLLLATYKSIPWSKPSQPNPFPKIQELVPEPEERDIVGTWIPIEDVVHSRSPRRFLDNGEMLILGCGTYQGTYRYLDHQTIETKVHKNEIYRWSIGFTQGKLIMINQQTGWVEEYYQFSDGKTWMVDPLKEGNIVKLNPGKASVKPSRLQ